MIKRTIAGIAIAFLTLVAFVSFAAWSCNSPAVDLGDLNRIQVGMTKGQVQEILGKPDDETSAITGSGSHWWYKNPLKWYALRIDFTADGKLIRYIHDD